MKVIFSHGKESGPWGGKIKRLAQLAESHGCKIDSIDYQDLPDDAEARISRLQDVVRQERQPPILVGSSMGGYVSLVCAAREKCNSVFLLAPALYMPGYQEQDYLADVPVELVHGWQDDVIAVENSIRYAKSSDNNLHLIKGDHRLMDALPEIELLFDLFMSKALGKY